MRIRKRSIRQPDAKRCGRPTAVVWLGFGLANRSCRTSKVIIFFREMFKFHCVRPIFFAVSSALFVADCAAEAGPILSPPKAFEQARACQITLIDIRTPQAWRQTGVEEGAERIDITKKTLGADIRESVDGEMDAPIAIISRTGNRTTYAQKALQEIGFSRVVKVKEGMAGSGAGPGWVRRALGQCVAERVDLAGAVGTEGDRHRRGPGESCRFTRTSQSPC
jgi:rhodanese-related sulfurtransferase